jgi:hypothetical protein
MGYKEMANHADIYIMTVQGGRSELAITRSTRMWTCTQLKEEYYHAY